MMHCKRFKLSICMSSGHWSIPEIGNALHELSKHLVDMATTHLEALKRAVVHCVATDEHGLKLQPNAKWNGKDCNYEFMISGCSNSDFAECPGTR